jgi:hypothetical protein
MQTNIHSFKLNDFFALGPKICSASTFCSSLARFCSATLGLLYLLPFNSQPLSLIDRVQFRPFDTAKASLLLTFMNFASQNSGEDMLRGSARASRQELPALM